MIMWRFSGSAMRHVARSYVRRSKTPGSPSSTRRARCTYGPAGVRSASGPSRASPASESWSPQVISTGRPARGTCGWPSPPRMSASTPPRSASADGDLHPRLLQPGVDLRPGGQVEPVSLPLPAVDFDPHDTVAISVRQGMAGVRPGQGSAASVDADDLVLGLVGNGAEYLFNRGNQRRRRAGLACSFQTREARSGVPGQRAGQYAGVSLMITIGIRIAAVLDPLGHRGDVRRFPVLDLDQRVVELVGGVVGIEQLLAATPALGWSLLEQADRIEVAVVQVPDTGLLVDRGHGDGGGPGR